MRFERCALKNLFFVQDETSCFDGRYTEENNGLIRWGFHIERSKNEKGLVTLPASAKRSEVAAWMNFSMKSRMVNHNAVKVGSVASGVKCYQVKICLSKTPT